MLFCELFKKVQSLSEEYDSLYKQALYIRDKWNLCGIKNGSCIAGAFNFSQCCKGCKFLGEFGCTTNALTCRLYYCSLNNYGVVTLSIYKLSKLKKLKKSTSKFYAFRGTKYDSLFISTFGYPRTTENKLLFDKCCKLLNILIETNRS